MQVEYSFEKQLALWKLGEQQVYKHLRKKEKTVDVKDLSDIKAFQPLGIDAMRIYESNSWIMFATFFDVKTDYLVHKTGNLFIETNSNDEKKGCMLTTKAELFMYYDPMLWKLYQLPIYAFRKWYKDTGVARKHLKVSNKTYSSEWIAMPVEELLQIIPSMEVEDIETLELTWF